VTGRLAVLGMGTMGRGIAQVAAQAGYAVAMYDPHAEQLTAARTSIEKTLEKGVSLGKVTDADRKTTLARIRTAADLAGAVRDATVVIEAAPEKLDLKRDLFAAIEPLAPADALLASNTSSLSITALARGLKRQERFLGLHFFNPVHLMALVEVVRGQETSDATVEAGVAIVRALGKEPIVVRDAPGFASSRLGITLGLEAMRMVEEGVASAEDIDRAMELGYRHPMGPLKLTDLVGLDVRLGIAEYLHAELGSETFRPPEILRRLVAEGKLGKKTGRGFYDWSEG
jgi:3-hydroxybutyryl-CoA dehydrogenase